MARILFLGDHNTYRHTANDLCTLIAYTTKREDPSPSLWPSAFASCEANNQRHIDETNIIHSLAHFTFSRWRRDIWTYVKMDSKLWRTFVPNLAPKTKITGVKSFIVTRVLFCPSLRGNGATGQEYQTWRAWQPPRVRAATSGRKKRPPHKHATNFPSVPTLSNHNSANAVLPKATLGRKYISKKKNDKKRCHALNSNPNPNPKSRAKSLVNECHDS